MTNAALWETFRTMFPDRSKDIVKFHTTRRDNTITLESRSHKRYSWFYKDPDTWKLSTITL